MIDFELDKNEPTDEEILERAYHNAWLLFSGQKSFTQIALGTHITESYMPFDPYETMNEEKFETTRDNMLAWYIETEEYEKCAYLRDFTYEKYVFMMEPFDLSNELK